MSHLAGMAFTLAASSSKSKTSSSSGLFFLVILVAFGALWYFVLRPQQQRARKAREQGLNLEVGDEIVTVGGIVGTVLETEGDRVTILTGGGSGDGVPTRIVLVRQAIARKTESALPADHAVGEDGDSTAVDEDEEDEHSEHSEHDVDEQPEDPEPDEGDGDDSGPARGQGGRRR